MHRDKKSIATSDVEATLARAFQITAEEANELLPSGRVTRLYSRVQWALTYLRQAGLLKSVARGINEITTRGSEYLASCPDVIKPSDLAVFPEFVAFQRRETPTSNETTAVPPSKTPGLAGAVEDKATPEEAIDVAYQALKDALAHEVLSRVKAMPPAFFEQLIVRLMLKLGYGGSGEDAGRALGKSGDGGVDGVINQDKLGLEKIYLQAKRWDDGSVGRKEVQAFVGALSGQGASKGVFITTSTFTREAKQYANNNHSFKLSLVEGVELARLMIDHDLGVALVQRYDVKRIDSDFFVEE